jgi:hypothetical protein
MAPEKPEDLFGNASNNAGEFGWAVRADLLDQVPNAASREVDAVIGTPATAIRLPMKLRFDFLRLTETSVLVNITMQFENRDLQFMEGGGVDKAIINVFGRVTSRTRRPVTTFEPTLETDAPPDALDKFKDQRQIYQQSVPLSPGQYRVNIVAKDTMSGNVNSYEAELDVPHFDIGKLAVSSLILADTIEKLPARQIGGSMFAIGDTKVRPRLGSTFTSAEKMGIYLQVYNLTQPSGSVEYEVDESGSNEKVMDVSEEVATIPYASTSQVTIQKLLPLTTLAPGAYTLKVTVTDRTQKRTIQTSEKFAITQ